MASAAIWQVTRFLGLNTSTTPAEINPFGASVLQNLYLAPAGTKLIQRLGQTPVGTSRGAGDADMLEWEKLAATEYLLMVHGTRLTDLYAGTTYSLSGGYLPFSASGETNAAWLGYVGGGAVVLGNGSNQNLRFRPSHPVPLGFVAVKQVTAAPTLATSSSSPTYPHAAGSYDYKISFLNVDGIYGEAGPSVSVTAGGFIDISVQSIQKPAYADDVSGRVVWRRSGGSTVYRKAVTLSDNVSTIWIDTVTDDSLLGEELDEARTRFPECRYLVEANNRLFGAYCLTPSGDVRTLYVSDVNNPGICRTSTDIEDDTQGGQFPLNGPAAGTITGLAAYGSAVCVFTGGAMFLFTGIDQPRNMQLTRFCDVGAVSHRGILTTREALYWPAEDGFYKWAGGPVERISDDIRPTYRSIPASGLAQSSSFIYDGKLFFCWPQGALVYHLAEEQWSSLTNVLCRDTTVTRFTSDALPRLYGARAGSGWVWQMESGLLDNGQPIAVEWQSADVDLETPVHNKRIHSYGGLVRTGTGTVTGALYRNTGSTPLVTKTLPLSGTGSVVRLRQRAPEQALSEHFRLGFSASASGGTFELVSANLEWYQAGKE